MLLHKIHRYAALLGPVPGLLGAMGVGLIFCIFLAFLIHVGPIELLAAIWEGAWGSADAAATSLGKATPLLLTGLAVSLAYQTGLLNIGCEGQLTLGALAAAATALIAAPLPRVLLAPLTVLAGALAGGLWAFPAVLLRQRRGVHEVISTLLLNYVALYVADYLVLGPLGDGTSIGRTAPVPPQAEWGPLWHLGTLGITAAPLCALLLCFMTQVWLTRTVWGFEVTSTGSNISAAQSMGVPVARWQKRMFLLSGALAGVAGAMEVLAVHHRFYRAFSPGYGFDGITVAFLVNATPGWLWLSALLLAGMRTADKWLQLALGVSPNVILIIQAVLLLSAASQTRLGSRVISFFSPPAKDEATAAEPTTGIE